MPSKEAADGSGRFGAFNAPARRPRSMGLRDLSDEMFEHYKRSNQMHHLQQAFSSLPVRGMLPGDWCSASGAQPERSASRWTMLQTASWQRASCLIHLAFR